MITSVEIDEKLRKKLHKVPMVVRRRLFAWIMAVEEVTPHDY